MLQWLSPLRLRAVTFVAAAGILLSGCAGGAAYDPGLSPAQNQLRQSNARFNQTVGEGAGAGALLGGLAGLALGGRNRGQAMLIGAAAGGAMGVGAGYAVARNNLSRASSEAQFNDAIQQASADSDAFRSAAEASRQVADQATAEARSLNQQLRAGQIARAQYQSMLTKYQGDNVIITRQITEAERTAATMRQSASVASEANREQLISSARNVEAARKQLERGQLQMLRAMEGKET
jgi:hypothetical protein